MNETKAEKTLEMFFAKKQNLIEESDPAMIPPRICSKSL